MRSISIGDRPALEDLVRPCSAARLVPLLDRVFAFDDARAVFDYRKSTHHIGKMSSPLPRSLYVYLTYHRGVNSIDWQPRALRQLRKIDAHAGKQIRRAVSSELTDLTKARNVKALTGHEYGYRLRVGNYRVFFDFDGAIQIVSIKEVRKRDERTY